MKLHNPFRTALVATLGVGLGIMLIQSVQTLSTILLYVGTALFLSLGLDPMVSWLTRRRLPRWAAVLITILVVLGVFAGIVLMVCAPLVAPLPGPAGTAFFAGGMMLVLRNSARALGSSDFGRPVRPSLPASRCTAQ